MPPCTLFGSRHIFFAARIELSTQAASLSTPLEGKRHENKYLTGCTGFEPCSTIVISTNKDQAVTLKFNPGNRILMKLFMKAKVNFSTNFSGSVDGEDEQGLQLDCSGTASTTVSVTVTGNGNL